MTENLPFDCKCEGHDDVSRLIIRKVPSATFHKHLPDTPTSDTAFETSEDESGVDYLRRLVEEKKITIDCPNTV